VKPKGMNIIPDFSPYNLKNIPDNYNYMIYSINPLKKEEILNYFLKYQIKLIPVMENENLYFIGKEAKEENIQLFFEYLLKNKLFTDKCFVRKENE